MCDIFSSPTSSPLLARQLKSNNTFSPIRNLIQSGRDYLRFSPTFSAGVATLGKRQRASSNESSGSSSGNCISTSSSPTRIKPPPPSPASSPSTIVQPSSSPSVILSSPLAPPNFLPPTPTPTSRRIRAAIQNIDESHNAVVITALEEIPFCCHEDLLTMSHEQLITTASSLNSKLPNVLQIDTDKASDASIRRNIEALVGITKLTSTAPSSSAVDPPGAPKGVKSGKAPTEERDDDVEIEHANTHSIWPPSSPGIMSSPLAKRAVTRATRTRDLGNLATVGTPRLARLEEEDEFPRIASAVFAIAGDAGTADEEKEDLEESQRAKKRRKLSGVDSGILRRWSGSLVGRNGGKGNQSRDLDSLEGDSMDVDTDVDADSPGRSFSGLQMYHLKPIPSTLSRNSSKCRRTTVGSSTTPTRTSRGGLGARGRDTQKRHRSMSMSMAVVPDALKKLGLSANEASPTKSSGL